MWDDAEPCPAVPGGAEQLGGQGPAGPNAGAGEKDPGFGLEWEGEALRGFREGRTQWLPGVWTWEAEGS